MGLFCNVCRIGEEKIKKERKEKGGGGKEGSHPQCRAWFATQCVTWQASEQ